MKLADLVNRTEDGNIEMHPVVAIFIILALVLLATWLTSGIVRNIWSIIKWM